MMIFDIQFKYKQINNIIKVTNHMNKDTNLQSNLRSNQYTTSNISIYVNKSQRFKMLFILITIVMILSTVTTKQVSAQANLLQNDNLSAFVNKHVEANNLLELSMSKISKDSSDQSQLLYFYSASGYAQICYKTSQNSTILPKFLKLRSYRPVSFDFSEIKCYQILDKLQLLEQPSVQFPSIDLSEPEQNKKYRKQKQYLINQYNLIKWVYNLGLSLDKELVNLNLKSKNADIAGFSKFSVLFKYDGSAVHIQQIWRQNQNQKTLNNRGYKITKKLAGKGLHQQVIYTIKLDSSKKAGHDINGQECYVSIVDTLPHSTYVDVDQLKSQGHTLILESGEQFGDGFNYINIQKPAYLSRQYQYEMRIPWAHWNNTSVNQYQIKTPIHFRYPTPYHLQKKEGKKQQIQYVQIDLHPLTNANIICKSNEKVALNQDYLVSRGAADIPVGDGEMKYAVNVITLGSSIICAILLIRRLRK